MVVDMSQISVTHEPKTVTERTTVFYGARTCGHVEWWRHVKSLSPVVYLPVLSSGEKLEQAMDLQSAILILVQRTLEGGVTAPLEPQVSNDVMSRFAAVKNQGSSK